MTKISPYANGNIFPSLKYGDFEIIEKLPNRKHRIRFLDTGAEHEAHQSGISKGEVKDPSVVGIRKGSIQIGDTFQIKKYGFVEVIGHPAPNFFTVKFLNTGWTTEATPSVLKKGYLRDHSLPYVYKSGHHKDPKKGSLNIQVGDTYFTNNGDEYEVIDIENSNKVTIRFTTGNTKVIRSTAIRWGKIYNCMAPSYMGVGYLGTDNPSDPYIIRVWHGMISRHVRDEYPSTVCPEWFNYSTFDRDVRGLINFDKWYASREAGRCDYHLDKDIRVFGNTLYSPETCLFALAEDNNAESHIRKAITGAGKDSRVGQLLMQSHRELAFKYTNVRD